MDDEKTLLADLSDIVARARRLCQAGRKLNDVLRQLRLAEAEMTSRVRFYTANAQAEIAKPRKAAKPAS